MEEKIPQYMASFVKCIDDMGTLNEKFPCGRYGSCMLQHLVDILCILWMRDCERFLLAFLCGNLSHRNNSIIIKNKLESEVVLYIANVYMK